jgi:hypothetical protein
LLAEEMILMEEDKNIMRWHQHTVDVRSAQGFAWNYCPFTANQSLLEDCIGLPNPMVARVGHILDVAWATLLKEQNTEKLRRQEERQQLQKMSQALRSGRAPRLQHRKKMSIWADISEAELLHAMRKEYSVSISQGIQRAKPGRLHCNTTTSCIFHFGLRSVLDGVALCNIQGWPRGRDSGGPADYKCVSQTALRDLSGEGYNLPCMGLCKYAYYINPHAPWNQI